MVNPAVSSSPIAALNDLTALKDDLAQAMKLGNPALTTAILAAIQSAIGNLVREKPLSIASHAYYYLRIVLRQYQATPLYKFVHVFLFRDHDFSILPKYVFPPDLCIHTGLIRPKSSCKYRFRCFK